MSPALAWKLVWVWSHHLAALALAEMSLIEPYSALLAKQTFMNVAALVCLTLLQLVASQLQPEAVLAPGHVSISKQPLFVVNPALRTLFRPKRLVNVLDCFAVRAPHFAQRLVDVPCLQSVVTEQAPQRHYIGNISRTKSAETLFAQHLPISREQIAVVLARIALL